VNQPAHLVNEEIEAFFAERVRDDLLLLYVSCHGVKDDNGRLYFASSNTKLRRLAATAVSSVFVGEQMDQCRSRKIVLLLDCCYSGAFARGMVPRAAPSMDLHERFDGRGRVVITASTAMEYAFEVCGGELSGTGTPSLFTGALVRGLRTGDADRDGDGRISVDELYDYVYESVRDARSGQTPSMASNVQGELYVAAGPAAAVPAAAVPAAAVPAPARHGSRARRASSPPRGRRAAGCSAPRSSRRRRRGRRGRDRPPHAARPQPPDPRAAAGTDAGSDALPGGPHRHVAGLGGQGDANPALSPSDLPAGSVLAIRVNADIGRI
jgi:uncharacterized caspase-like protein